MATIILSSLRRHLWAGQGVEAVISAPAPSPSQPRSISRPWLGLNEKLAVDLEPARRTLRMPVKCRSGLDPPVAQLRARLDTSGESSGGPPGTNAGPAAARASATTARIRVPHSVMALMMRPPHVPASGRGTAEAVGLHAEAHALHLESTAAISARGAVRRVRVRTRAVCTVLLAVQGGTITRPFDRRRRTAYCPPQLPSVFDPLGDGRHRRHRCRHAGRAGGRALDGYRSGGRPHHGPCHRSPAPADRLRRRLQRGAPEEHGRGRDLEAIAGGTGGSFDHGPGHRSRDTAGPVRRHVRGGPVQEPGRRGDLDTHSGRRVHQPEVKAIAVDPAHPQTVYFAADNYGDTAGINKTTDGGATWTVMNEGLPKQSRTYAVAVDPKTPSTVYAGLSGNGVYKSTDGAVTWSLASRSRPAT